MNKKILSIFLILFMSTILSSCIFKKPNTKTTPPNPSSPVQPQPSKDKSIEEDTLRFVVMADSRGSDGGVNSEVIIKTLEKIKTLSPQPSFAVMPGDLVTGASSYSKVKTQLENFKNIITKYYPIEFFYPGFGNHEATAGIKAEQAFQEVFSEFNANFLDGYSKTVYYFDSGNARFYMLNSNHPGEEHEISDKQLDFITANMDSSKKHNYYFFHEPAYPTGTHIGDSLDANKLQRDKFWSLIDASNSPIAFCGHEHNYTRRHINSDFNEGLRGESFKFNKTVYQITTGTFGAPIYKGYGDSKNVDVPPISEYHFAVVDMSEAKTIVTVYNLEGKVIDSF
ncbi:metallophosphoesterase family protein [Clostridium omnivorum]|uniref:Calcineurin-like phosphoesterase domain-containing protein n=1 Tax=Clostridium omnivorum TaxID=1604902 RepID=A0ABQ5N4I9_9CLOT|nr:metallophosphoesterase [Clostridium sp. E14]GLC30124.1 hypothetical protein bsdE14_15340 [Clostridium sp. E14]